MNTAGAPLLEMIAVLKQDIGFEVIITKNIKTGEWGSAPVQPAPQVRS